jgi:hypothetical protein
MSGHRNRKTLAILRATLSRMSQDDAPIEIVPESKKHKVRCQAFDVSADSILRAVTKRLYTGDEVNTTTGLDNATFLSENDTGDLFHEIDDDMTARAERVARYKELVDRGFYRPDMMIVASRILSGFPIK